MFKIVFCATHSQHCLIFNTNFFNMAKKIFVNSSFFILCILSLTLIISNISFAFGGHITILNMVISLLISFFLLVHISQNKIVVLLSVAISAGVCLVTFIFANIYFDTSWDGQGYHQETIYLLKNGWNPVLEQSQVFRWWVNYYQKGNEIIQANIYLLTDKIEAGKMLNILLVYVAAFTSFSFLDTFKLKLFYKFLISFIIVFNPVVFTQVFTYYIDANWYLTLVISLGSVLTFLSTKKVEYCVFFILSSVMFCSLKFSSIPTFIVVSIFVLVYNYIYGKGKIVIPYLTVFLLAFICNIHPFLTNIKNGYPIFHPFVGDQKVDILNENIPVMLLNRNRVERLFISLFSETSNNTNAILSKTLKLPFTTTVDQFFINYDTRLGGFGFLFSGILIIAVLLALYLFFVKSFQLHLKIYLFVLVGILCTVAINPASWWARLSPQIWLIPIAIIVFGLLSTNKFCLILTRLSILLFMINILIPGYITYRKLKDDNKTMNDFVNSVGDKTIILDLSNQFGFQQYYLKFKERNIKYETGTMKDKRHLAPFTPDVYYEIEER